MSLLQKASILTTPTAYAEDYLYSIKPVYSLGSELVINGDFATGSDWTGQTGWSISGGSANFTATGSYAYLLQNVGFVTGRTYKFSFEVKNYVSGGVKEDISGVEHTANGVYTHYIVATGSILYFYANTTFTGSIDNVSAKEVTDADFDFDRNSTATRVNEEGLIEEVAIDTPRIDFTGGTGSILLEPSSTNLVTYSEDFSQWLLIGITTTANAVISPDGLLNASKLVATSGSSNKVIAQGITANTYTASVFAKKGEFEGIIISTGTTGAFFNLNTNTYRTYYTSPPTSYNIENYGNGWYRYSITFTQALGDSIYIGPNDNVSTSLAITGNGTSGIYTFGAQLEALSYPTSYIPTNGSTQTRSADAATNAGNSDLISSTEGVLYVEAKVFYDSSHTNRIALSDGTSNNRITLEWDETTQNRIRVHINTHSLLSYDVSDLSVFNKVAIKYALNDYALWFNGVEVVTQLSGALPTGMDVLEMTGAGLGAAGSFYGNVKCVAVFKEALTDTELTKLTS